MMTKEDIRYCIDCLSELKHIKANNFYYCSVCKENYNENITLTHSQLESVLQIKHSLRNTLDSTLGDFYNE